MAASPRAEHQKFRAAAAAELPPSVGFFFPTWEFPSLQLWCVSLRVLELLTVPFSAIFPCLQPDLLQLQFTCFPHSFFSQRAALLRGPSQGHADAPCGNPGIRDRAEPSQGSLARLKFKTASPHLHRNDIKYCLDIICLLISLSAFKKKKIRMFLLSCISSDMPTLGVTSSALRWHLQRFSAQLSWQEPRCWFGAVDGWEGQNQIWWLGFFMCRVQRTPWEGSLCFHHVWDMYSSKHFSLSKISQLC